MRDINRIPAFLQTIKECWELLPDLRFGQMMSNFLFQLPRDPFFYEDNEFIEKFEKYMKEE